MERGIRKILTFVKRQIASKSFGKIIPQPLQFRKDSSLFRLNFNVYINVGNKERARARNRKRMVAGSELKTYAEETTEKKRGDSGGESSLFPL